MSDQLMTEHEDSVTPQWDMHENPIHWALHDLDIIADRYLPCGRRQHLVKGNVAKGLSLSNADIFSENDTAALLDRDGGPCFIRLLPDDDAGPPLSIVIVIGRVAEDIVKINFKDQMMPRAKTSLWTKADSRKSGECAATGECFAAGTIVYRPMGNVFFRSHRVIATVVDGLV